MTLTQIKEKLGYSVLELNKSKDVEGNTTPWFRHWDNDKRVAVSIHEELLTELKKNPNQASNLGLQSEMRMGNKGEYTSYRIVGYNSQPAEVTL